MADAPDPLLLPRLPRVRRAAPRGTTWWGRAFVRSCEELVVDATDLPAGRALARSGRLGAIVVLPGFASAGVDAGGGARHLAQLTCRVLDDDAWATFAGVAAAESGFVGALESGLIPAELAEQAEEAGVEVLPGVGDLDTACDCDAWALPCVHALALLHQLAWRIDADPYVLLLLRGRGRDAVLGELETDAVEGPRRAERDDAATRASRILRLAEEAPDGHGLADAAVAAYDEQVAGLVDGAPRIGG
jgi:uncharacterized Zn finger protein